LRMDTLKRAIGLFACFMLLSAVPFGAMAMPEWTFPLSPEIISNREGYLTLANKEVLLSGDYEPDDLVTLTVRKVYTGMQMRKAASLALEEMFEAAEADGCILYVKSAYRSYQTQKTMYSNRVSSMGYDDGLVQKPGASDHQTGLGCDILNLEWTRKEKMNKDFAAAKEAQWMAENCWRFGFVIRYMEDKEEETGIKYEPWHLRYVGKEAAQYMYEHHQCLEDFTADWQGYLADWESRGGSFERLLLQLNQLNDVIVLETNDEGEEELSIFY